MMHRSTLLGHPRGWKAWVCGVAIVAASFAGAAVSGAAPTVPGAPTITGVTAGLHNITIRFDRPSSNGGSSIFNYKATCTSSNGGATRSSSDFNSPIRVSATGGDTYTCTVMAQNRAGFGPPSAPSGPVVVLPILPGAPTITGVTPGDHDVRVAFTKPASNGGSPIFNYKATCASNNGGATRSASEFRSPIQVGLSSGHTYTCTVAAQNSAGFGPPSAQSAPFVVLPIVPDAPTMTSVTAGFEDVSVAFSPPAPNGATHIFDYKAECFSSNGGFTRSNDRSASPIHVSDLTGGDTYTCTVMAKNDVGFGPPSAASTPFVTLGASAAPGAPTITSATAGPQSVSVTFSAPASNGGAPIVNYEATCFSNGGGVTRSHDQSASPIVVGSLTAGDTYTCVVLAKNTAGFGPPSAPSAPVVTPT